MRQQNASVYTVTQVNHAIKLLLEEQEAFCNLYIQGELSNYKKYSAVMFRSDAARLRFQPENGMKVIARGRIGVYPQRGQYQMYVADMMPDGIGALTIAFEQLKQKLYQEGLFDEAHKQPIPRLPERIAVVTSPTGAAVRDILRILKRRYPIAQVVIYPVLVQGKEAAGQIASAIQAVNRRDDIDVMIVGRGGGSLEDLWAFNEEIVARAIYASKIPVISAVGHEPDITISDFVADARASTPSNAAEIVAADSLTIRNFLYSADNALRGDMQETLHACRLKLEALDKRRKLRTPKGYIQDKRYQLEHVSSQMVSAMQRILAADRQRFVEQAAYLDAYSPLKVLSRGYSVVTKDHVVVSSSAKLRKEDEILVRFAKGGAVCTVKQVKRKL